MSHKGLRVRGLKFRYPRGAWVLDGLDLAVSPGECVAVSGGNGAGKSTLLSILAGIIPQFVPGELQGECLFDGTPVHEHRCACLRQNPDDQILCDEAREELEFFLRHASGPKLAADELARRMGIEDLMGRPVHKLSGGEKQRFALASSLAFSDGRLLLLDEPTAFLDLDGRQRLARVLAAFKARGACILMAGHEHAGLESLVDRAILLGSVPRPSQEPQFPARTPPGPVLLSAEKLSAGGVFTGLSFELRAGETLGIFGPNGSGKSTLARVLAGLEVPSGGLVRLSGRRVDKRGLWKAVAMAGQNPYHGLLHGALRECLESSRRCRAGEPAMTLEHGVALLGLKGLLGRDPQTLSFGEAQKAAVLAAALSGPKVLIVDEPLLDLDASSLGGLRAVCAALGRAGGAALIISHVPGVLEGFCARPPVSLEEARCATMPAA